MQIKRKLEGIGKKCSITIIFDDEKRETRINPRNTAEAKQFVFRVINYQ